MAGFTCKYGSKRPEDLSGHFNLYFYSKAIFMKTIGLIGGISWVSTQDYYRYLNEGINARLGGLSFARCIIHSFNYADIKKNNDNNDWDQTFTMIREACLQMEAAGAEAILLCANTMHMLADELRQQLQVPLIHIAEVTAAAIRERGLHKVGLLGTKFTMEKDFFRSKLEEAGIEMLIPEADDRDFVHHTIAEELGKGILLPETRRRYLDIIEKLAARGAEGAILGCTEIPLLIRPEDTTTPVFDTTLLHARAAVDFALS